MNNNGNLAPYDELRTFTPEPLVGNAVPIIAPFWADVDTRVGSTVTYGSGRTNGRQLWCANWIRVGYFPASSSNRNTNSFQVCLLDASEQTGTTGDFDIEFNYIPDEPWYELGTPGRGSIQWEAGSASYGDPLSGRGGSCARVGWTNGNSESFELPGSSVCGALLDRPYSDPSVASPLAYTSNVDQPGRWAWPVRILGSSTPGSGAQGVVTTFPPSPPNPPPPPPSPGPPPSPPPDSCISLNNCSPPPPAPPPSPRPPPPPSVSSSTDGVTGTVIYSSPPPPQSPPPPPDGAPDEYPISPRSFACFDVVHRFRAESRPLDSIVFRDRGTRPSWALVTSFFDSYSFAKRAPVFSQLDIGIFMANNDNMVRARARRRDPAARCRSTRLRRAALQQYPTIDSTFDMYELSSDSWIMSSFTGLAVMPDQDVVDSLMNGSLDPDAREEIERGMNFVGDAELGLTISLWWAAGLGWSSPHNMGACPLSRPRRHVALTRHPLCHPQACKRCFRWPNTLSTNSRKSFRLRFVSISRSGLNTTGLNSLTAAGPPRCCGRRW